MARDILVEHKKIWDRKPVLREIYTDLYRRIFASIGPGLCLEIGGGSGWGKDLAGNEVISTDIVEVPWIDAVADAQRLPFSTSSFTSIIAVDVLHHIGHPKMFFEEAARVLCPGGRIVLVEPAITPVSWVFYNYFHEELVDMSVNPLADEVLSDVADPFDANQAIPSLIFGKYRGSFAEIFPELELVENRKISLFAYPLSGGFKSWSLLPARLVRPMLAMESMLLPLVGWLMAFRHMVVIEKRGSVQVK